MIGEISCQSRGCKHYRGVTDAAEVDPSKPDDPRVVQQHYCAAFPLGIPREIAVGVDDHIKPRPDDRGIQFEAGEADLYAPIDGVDEPEGEKQ